MLLFVRAIFTEQKPIVQARADERAVRIERARGVQLRPVRDAKSPMPQRIARGTNFKRRAWAVSPEIVAILLKFLFALPIREAPVYPRKPAVPRALRQPNP